MPKITITKINHDSWWGYYIGEKLYRYNDYYNFSDDEVKKEALLQAIDEGIIKTRKDPINVDLVYHTDWPGFQDERIDGVDLYDVVMEEFSNELPETLTEFRQFCIDQNLPESAVKGTCWKKMGDHPKVWADYDSSCGGDTDNGRFYISNGNENIEVFYDDEIYDMADGTFRTSRSTSW